MDANAAQNREVATEYSITSYPTLNFFPRKDSPFATEPRLGRTSARGRDGRASQDSRNKVNMKGRPDMPFPFDASSPSSATPDPPQGVECTFYEADYSAFLYFNGTTQDFNPQILSFGQTFVGQLANGHRSALQGYRNRLSSRSRGIFQFLKHDRFKSPFASNQVDNISSRLFGYSSRLRSSSGLYE